MKFQIKPRSTEEWNTKKAESAFRRKKREFEFRLSSAAEKIGIKMPVMELSSKLQSKEPGSVELEAAECAIRKILGLSSNDAFPFDIETLPENKLRIAYTPDLGLNIATCSLDEVTIALADNARVACTLTVQKPLSSHDWARLISFDRDSALAEMIVHDSEVVNSGARLWSTIQAALNLQGGTSIDNVNLLAWEDQVSLTRVTLAKNEVFVITAPLEPTLHSGGLLVSIAFDRLRWLKSRAKHEKAARAA